MKKTTINDVLRCMPFVLVPCQSMAELQCDGLLDAIDAAASQFAEIQGPYDQQLEEYQTTLQILDGYECQIDVIDAELSYACVRRTSTEADARLLATRLSDSVASCLRPHRSITVSVEPDFSRYGVSLFQRKSFVVSASSQTPAVRVAIQGGSSPDGYKVLLTVKQKS